MNDAKHTPGPWGLCESDALFIEGPRKGAERPLAVIRSRNGYDDLPTPEDLANAALIAAAPDLLAAAQKAYTVFASILELAGESEAKTGGPLMKTPAGEVLAMVDADLGAAIKKATEPAQ